MYRIDGERTLDKFMEIHDLNMDENLLNSQPLINECSPNEITEKFIPALTDGVFRPLKPP